MILFPLPSKNIRKEKHVSQGSKSATLSHGFPYASYLLFFLNEVLVVEAMAKCWRNVRSEHLISSSQDTYRVFFQIEIISQGTHRCDTRPVLSKSARINGNQKIPRSSASSPSGRRERHQRFKFQVRPADAMSSIHLCCQNHQTNAPQLLMEKQLLCIELEMFSERNTEEPENQLIILMLVTSWMCSVPRAPMHLWSSAPQSWGTMLLGDKKSN